MTTHRRAGVWVAIVATLGAALAAPAAGAAAAQAAAAARPASALPTFTAAPARAVAWQPQRMSLIVGVSSVAQHTDGTARLAAILRDIRANHRDPRKPGFIQSIVLQDIAPSGSYGSPLYTAVLDTLAPYLPGGARASFDTAFVGTLVEPDAPPGAPATWSPYVDGITDSALTSAHLAASARAAAAFAARYPALTYDWYLSWEAFLPALMYADSFAYPQPPRITPSVIRAANLAYQTRLIQKLSAIRPGRAFLWSPALDRSWAQVRVDGQAAVVQQNLQSYFAALRAQTGAALWLDPQDGLSRPCLMVGGAYGNTVADRVEWLQRLAAMRLPVAALQVNSELFASPYCSGASAPAQVLARLSAYQQNGIPIGPSYEIFSWYRSVAQGR